MIQEQDTERLSVIFRFKPLISKETGLQKLIPPTPPSSKSGGAVVTGCPERATVAQGPTAVRDKPVIPNQSLASSAEHTLAPLQ